MTDAWEELDEAEIRRRRIITETVDRIIGAVGLVALLLLLPISLVSGAAAEHFFWTIAGVVLGIGLFKPVLIRDGSIK